MEKQILEIMRKWGSRIQTHQYDECAAELSQLIDLRKELIDFFEWFSIEACTEDIPIEPEYFVDKFLASRPDSKAITDEIRQPDLTCDVCGRHPAVIVQTQFGRYCMKHARYV